MGYFSRAVCTLSCDWLIAWLIVIVFQAIFGLPCASVSKRVHLKMSMIRMKMNQQEGNISMWMQYAFAGGHRQLRNAFLFVVCNNILFMYIFTQRPTGAENLDRMGVLCKQTASKKNECPWLLERTGKSIAKV